LNTTGRPSRISRARRTSNPRQSAFAKFVAPPEEMTPSAVTGPGVSLEDLREGSRQRLDRLVRAVANAAWGLGHLLDEEPASRVKHRRVDRGATGVEPDYSPPIRFQHSACLPAAPVRA
jgi:hypothetical protein